MGQTLENGIYLPSEGERNCYDGLASNWTTLDVVVGGYRAHIANENIHITSAERSKWNNGVSQAYVLRYANTSLTALGTVAFSALDNTDNIKIGDKVLDSEGKLFALTAVDTASSSATLSALLIDLADDSGVVHKAGNETIDGNKTFNGDTRCVGELNQTVPFKMTSDTSFVTGTKNTRIYDQNGFLAANDPIIYNNSKNIRRAWYLYNNSSGATVSAGFNFILAASGQKVFYPLSDSDTDNGSSSAYWKNTYTKLVNGVSPSSLSMPYIANKIDISGYVTDLTGVSNEYTPLVNGWICVRSANATKISILDNATSVGTTNISPTATYLGVIVPCIANRKVNINIICTSLDFAYFIPCQGNI